MSRSSIARVLFLFMASTLVLAAQGIREVADAIFYNGKVITVIEAGKLADFVILSDDIMSVPEEQIRTITPLATYVGGKKAFSKSGSGF